MARHTRSLAEVQRKRAILWLFWGPLDHLRIVGRLHGRPPYSRLAALLGKKIWWFESWVARVAAIRSTPDHRTFH